ncbi:MAG: hypothetical protein P4L36_08665 [Holophaga sp.]|nr:hypothetical protein [Holophaga sp.]
MPPSPETPLAIYTERLPQVRRVFRLYPDRVEVAARWTFGRNYQIVVKLADLSGQISRFNVKNRWFPRGVMLGSIAVGFALVLSRSGYPDLVRRVAVFGWPLGGLAYMVALFSLPRRQFVHFPRANGKPGLDICKAGPDQARFEAFVSAVRQGITRS